MAFKMSTKYKFYYQSFFGKFFTVCTLTSVFNDKISLSVSHQWCDLFYRLLHSSTRHIEEVEGGEGEGEGGRSGMA
jgi:hypothetical protein